MSAFFLHGGAYSGMIHEKYMLSEGEYELQ